MLNEVPDGWAIVSLHQIAELSLGKMLDKEKNRGDLRPYLANINVRWGDFDLRNLRQMRFEEQELDRYGLKAGDIVMCEGGEPGRCALWLHDDSGIMLQKALHRIRPLEGVDSRYLYFALAQTGASGGFAKHLTGGGIKHLPGEKLQQVKVAVPPLDEQQRLAVVLGSADEAVSMAAKTADQHFTLWEGLAEDLIWRPAIEDSALLAPLGGSIGASDYGVNAPLHDRPDGIAILRMGNIQRGQIDLTNLKWGDIATNEADTLKLRDGDILFNRTNSRDLVGKVALVRGEPDYLYASYLVRLSIDRASADPYFVFAAMNSRRGQSGIQTIATPGVSQSNINPTNLKKLPFPHFDLARQQKISALLQDVETAWLEARRQVERLRGIRESLGSLLLSGRVRVPA